MDEELLKYSNEALREVSDELRAAKAELKAARAAIAKAERALEITVGERDEAENAIRRAYEMAAEHARPWSNVFGYKEALEVIQSTIDHCRRSCKILTESNEELGELIKLAENLKIYNWQLSLHSPTEKEPYRFVPLAVVDVGYSDKTLTLAFRDDLAAIPRAIISELQSRKGENDWLDRLLEDFSPTCAP